ncbi:MbeB family mobilization protein [Escherichia coli]
MKERALSTEKIIYDEFINLAQSVRDTLNSNFNKIRKAIAMLTD